jgi:hypothetical protein
MKKKSKPGNKIPFTDAQWQWVVDRYREGYPQTELARFLGLYRNTLFRNLQRLGAIPYGLDELDPLEERRAEFEALGEEEEPEESKEKFRYW